jgi:NADH-quinone oxidoreductase subunit J
VVLLELVGIAVYSASQPTLFAAAASRGLPIAGGNTENLGWVLYTDYLVPFEVASVLLLVAMIGAIVLARREQQM